MSAPDEDTEALHEFRTSFKRLKALYKLLTNLDANPADQGAYQRVRHVYRTAGEVRDISIITDVFGEHGLFTQMDDFRTFLDNIHREAYEAYRTDFEKFSVSLITALCDSLKVASVGLPDFETQLNGWMENRKSQLANVPVNHPDPSVLHKFRGRLKSLYYIREMLGYDMNLPEDNPNLQTVLKQQSDMIGHWHDLEIGRALFEQFIAGENIDKENSSAVIATLHQLIIDDLKSISHYHNNVLRPMLSVPD